MSYTVLARRYRPTSFDELVGQHPIARTLRNAIGSDRTAHAYLFCGTRGVGKTSMARIFAKALNVDESLTESDEIGRAVLRGDDLDVIEIDGASNRGINEARDLIAGAGLSPARCPYRIYIIDEVHMLTREAFNALLKTMEEPPSHVKFILCTTEPHRVPATIQSRCQRFDFRPIRTSEIQETLVSILDAEGITADADVVQQVARLGQGSMRDALSLLDRVLAAGESSLTLDFVQSMLGVPDHALVAEIVDAFVAGDAAAALRSGARLLEQGLSVESALELLVAHLRTVMVVQTCGDDSELLDVSHEEREKAVAQAKHFDAPGLVHLIALGETVARNARMSSVSRALYDATLVRMAVAEHLADLGALLEGDGDGVAIEPKKKTSPPVSASEPVTPRAPAPRAVPAAAPDFAAAAPDFAAAAPDFAAAAPDFAAAAPDFAAAAPVSAAAPAPTSGPASTSIDGGALWAKVLQSAARSPGDQARLHHLMLDSFDGVTLKLSVDAEGGAVARWLSTQRDWLVEFVRKATDQTVRIELDTSAAQPRSAPTGVPQLSEARDLPVVKHAEALFDAVVTGVETLETPKRRNAETPKRRNAETPKGREPKEGGSC